MEGGGRKEEGGKDIGKEGVKGKDKNREINKLSTL